MRWLIVVALRVYIYTYVCVCVVVIRPLPFATASSSSSSFSFRLDTQMGLERLIFDGMWLGKTSLQASDFVGHTVIPSYTAARKTTTANLSFKLASKTWQWFCFPKTQMHPEMLQRWERWLCSTDVSWIFNAAWIPSWQRWALEQAYCSIFFLGRWGFKREFS